MDNFNMFRFYACAFILLILLVSSDAFTCIHDKITTGKISSLSSRSINKKYQEIRNERDLDPSLFEPLKIFFYLDDFDPSLSQNVISNIQVSLNQIKDYIATTFQVRKRQRHFLLKRSACTRKLPFGENKGKCSSYREAPEVCESEYFNFEISRRFLDKLDVYDSNHTQPITTLPAGPGLIDSNFIQFITSQSSSFCEGTDVFAYATYCKVDEQTNEPLAGILNLCPNYFTRKIYTSQHYYNIILHELFHVLGFSSKMFEKFLPCRKGIPCDVPSNVIQADSTDTYRMMYPLVIQNMQSHFNCSNTDFGAPMDTQFATDTMNETTASGYTSHWHPVLMYSSIMTPKFNEFDDILVDNITLAAFASTGWYRVNFTNAQNFLFGKEQGCEFGMMDTCESPFLCDPSYENVGCDLQYKTVGVCTNMTPNHKCGVYQPHSREDCESYVEKTFGLDFYAQGYKQKCFMRQSSNGTATPSCLPIKCNISDSYGILINSTWYNCKDQEEVSVEGDSTIKCPDFLLFCPPMSIHVMSYAACPKDPPFIVLLRLYFGLPQLADIKQHRSFKNFKVTVIRKVADKIEIPVNYIVNASINAFKKVYIDFTICPPPSVTPEELIKIVSQSQKFLDGGSFHEILKGYKDLIISSNDVKTDPDYNIAFSDYEGFRTLLAFPVLCAIFLIVTFVASLVRMFNIRKGKLRRTSEQSSENPLPQPEKPS